jgi:uncharacterized protein YjhX (UPF0386 family)
MHRAVFAAPRTNEGVFMAAKKKARRTTHRSSKGTKLYAVRDSKGRIKDIQTYKRAHGADIKRSSKAEGGKKAKAKAKAKVKAKARRAENNWTSASTGTSN